jgi:hypothetical protein
MRELVEFARESAEVGLDFLLIGGHAVIALGYERTTKDIDFLVSEQQLAAWKTFFESRGYGPVRESPAFLQLAAPGKTDVDLMVVSAGTWEKLRAASSQEWVAGHALAIPAVLHLISLKLHAISQNPRRASRDLADINELVRRRGIDVRSREFRETVLRYSTQETYERFVKDHPPQ